jgi:predicted ATPase
MYGSARPNSTAGKEEPLNAKRVRMTRGYKNIMEHEEYQEETVPYDAEEEENRIKAKYEANGYEYITKVHDRANPGCWRLQFGKPERKEQNKEAV